MRCNLLIVIFNFQIQYIGAIVIYSDTGSQKYNVCFDTTFSVLWAMKVKIIFLAYFIINITYFKDFVQTGYLTLLKVS